MKSLRVSWKLVALFALGAVGSFFYVTRVKAFTLIEIQYLPAVQLTIDQSAEITVSNVSTSSVEATISVFRTNGTLMKQKTLTLAPGTTGTLPVNAGAEGLMFRGAIALSAASAAVANEMAFDKTTGEVIAIQPALLLPAVQ